MALRKHGHPSQKKTDIPDKWRDTDSETQTTRGLTQQRASAVADEDHGVCLGLSGRAETTRARQPASAHEQGTEGWVGGRAGGEFESDKSGQAILCLYFGVQDRRAIVYCRSMLTSRPLQLLSTKNRRDQARAPSPPPLAWVSTKVFPIRVVVNLQRWTQEAGTAREIGSCRAALCPYLLPRGRAVGDNRPDGHQRRVHGQVQRPQSGHR